MTTQWIVTALVLMTALFFTIRRMTVYFRKSPGKQKGCADFGGDCAACMKQRKT